VTEQLFDAQPTGFVDQAITPVRELGAYEALWADRSTSFKSLAAMFREHPECVPSDFVSPADAEKHAKLALSAIREAGIRHFGVRIHGAGDYPEQLRQARHPVELLYFQGDWSLASTRCIAVVGTRNPTPDGERRATKLSQLFVEAGFTVVSGLARGIDTIAHRTAIDAKGRTIAVIGTPITEYYPPENESLQREIADRFLLISQIPIVRYSQQTYRGNRLFFPERNITMSALTEGTVIVEASDTSGTLTQAQAALDQGRKLFILESCFRNSAISWPAKFEKLGALRVEEFDDIYQQLAQEESAEDR